MKLVVNVPDDYAKDWEDGEEYELKVRQTSPGKFDLVESEDETDEETEAKEAEGPETMKEAADSFNNMKED